MLRDVGEHHQTIDAAAVVVSLCLYEDAQDFKIKHFMPNESASGCASERETKPKARESTNTLADFHVRIFLCSRVGVEALIDARKIAIFMCRSGAWNYLKKIC